MPNVGHVLKVAMLIHAMMLLMQQVFEVLFSANHACDDVEDCDLAIDIEDDDVMMSLSSGQETLVSIDTIISSILHDMFIQRAGSILDCDLGYWVLPRSTTWFSHFLLTEYDDCRWVENFRMSKASIFSIANMLAPLIAKKDTKYRRAIPVAVRVACVLYKLANGSSLLVCSELFAMGKSTISLAIRDVVKAINMVFRQEISWPQGIRLQTCMVDFHDWCGLPGVVGAIDGTHFAIRKPHAAPEDYFYFKSGGYTIQCQAVVDKHKRFLDVVVGMPGSTNDSRVLRRSALFTLASTSNLFDVEYAHEGFTPYLLGDKGYPLLPWLMTPYRELPDGVHSIQDRLYNRQLRQGRSVVENAFAILKQTFRELLTVSDLHVTLLPDVVICCTLLHNILLGKSPEEVARRLKVLEQDGLWVNGNEDINMEPAFQVLPLREFDCADAKRFALGAFLVQQRQLP